MLITWRVNFGKGFMQSFSYVSVHCRWKKDKSCLPNSFYSSQVAQHHFRTKLRGFDVKNISCKKIKICPVSIAQCWLTSSVHMTLDLFDWTQWPPCFMFEGNAKTLVHILERTFISIMVSTWKKNDFIIQNLTRLLTLQWSMIKTIKEQQNRHSWPNIGFKIKILKSHITVH